MRSISLRLDDDTDSMLTAHCRSQGLTQTDAIKIAIQQLAGQHRATPAEIAAELGLIGGFSSAAGDLSRNHAQRVKETLGARLDRDARPLPVAPSRSAAAVKPGRRPTTD